MINNLKLFTVIIVISIISCAEEKKTVELKGIVDVKVPVEDGSQQPFLFSNNEKLIMSWTQKINDSVHTLNFSELSNDNWSEPIEIARGQDWFVNWADFPAIVENDGNKMVHYLQKSDSATFAYDIHLKISNDNGKRWNKDFILHRDSTRTEHGFVTMLPYKQNLFLVTWLDGRNTGGGSHGDGHSSNGAMTARTAIINSKGEVIEETLIDKKTCDCCQTTAALTPKGPIVVYRDRTDEEIRDIYISRFLDGSWTIPKSIHNDNWVINGCPVNGPKADSNGNTLAITWFTAADNIPKVKIIFSKDSGTNFDTPIQIDDGKPIGRVDVALLNEDTALVSWMESTENGAEIRILQVNSDGTKSKPVAITEISASRASGFPQMEIFKDVVYVAWNDVLYDQSTIKMISAPLQYFN